MSLQVNGVPLDDPQRVFVIAEGSANHGRDYATAVALTHAAAEAGASAIKWQTFTADTLAADVPLLRGYDAAHDAWLTRLGAQTMHDLFRQGGLPRPWHVPLQSLAASLGLVFLSTPFSLDDARFLVEQVRVPALKIASGDLTHRALLRYAGSTGLPVIVSTGASTLGEIHDALDVLDDGSQDGAVLERVCLLHCVSCYPCPLDAVNVRAVETLRYQALVAAYGFSDHTLSVDVVPALAVAYGATCYEKHLKLTSDATGVDTDHSLTPAQFATLVRVLREASLAVGNGVKQPHVSEAHERLWARRGTDDLRPTDAARAGRWA